MFHLSKIAVLSIFLGVVIFSFGGNYANAVDKDNASQLKSTNESLIDIYDEKTGDFLDADNEKYKKEAEKEYVNGNYEEAAKLYLTYLKSNTGDSSVIYNLACCYGLLNKERLAAKFLLRAVEAGFDNLNIIKVDPDFNNVRGTDDFNEVMDRIENEILRRNKTVYIKASSFFKCLVREPDNYNSKETYPLVVGLHGFNSNPERFITLRDRSKVTDFIYATPQAPYASPMGMELGYSWFSWEAGKETFSIQNDIIEDYVIGIIEELKIRYNIGDVYLMGFSQGCGLTYKIGIKYHNLFKGIMCYGGGLDIDEISEIHLKEAKNLKVFIGHGTKDTMVNINEAIIAKDFLQKAGYEVTFYKFDGAHLIPEDAWNAAIKWMEK